jgi:hypothetical protein
VWEAPFLEVSEAVAAQVVAAEAEDLEGVAAVEDLGVAEAEEAADAVGVAEEAVAEFLRGVAADRAGRMVAAGCSVRQ